MKKSEFLQTAYCRDFIDTHSDDRYYSREQIPVDGLPRLRYEGKRCIYPVNDSEDIKRGYRSYTTSKDEERFIPLGHFKGAGSLLHQIRRPIGVWKKGDKQWMFLKYQECDSPPWVIFDFDSHSQDEDPTENIERALQIEKDLGFKGVWTTSPGDVYDGYLLQGRYWLIRLAEPEFCFESKHIWNKFCVHYGLLQSDGKPLEHSFTSIRRNIRLVFQHRVHICEPLSGEYIFADSLYFDHKNAMSLFEKEVNAYDCTPQWNWKQYSAEWMASSQNIGVKPHSPPKTKKQEQHKEPLLVSSFGDTPPPEHIAQHSTEGDAFERAKKSKLHAYVCEQYKWNPNREEEIIVAANEMWKKAFPSSHKTQSWHVDRVRKTLKTVLKAQQETKQQDRQAVQPVYEIDIPAAVIVASGLRQLSERDCDDLRTVLEHMRKHEGRLSSKLLYRNGRKKGSLFSEKRWFQLRKVFGIGRKNGLLDESEYSFGDIRKCKQYRLSEDFLAHLQDTKIPH